MVFVRHALPGERVRAVVTEGRARDVLAGRRRRGARALAGPGGAAVPVGRPGPVRRLRLAARRAAGAARAEGGGGRGAAAPAGRPRPRRSRSRRCPATRTAGLAHPGAVRRRRRRPRRAAPAPLATSVVPVDHCRIAAPTSTAAAPAARWPGARRVEVVAVGDQRVVLVLSRRARRVPRRRRRGRATAEAVRTRRREYSVAGQAAPAASGRCTPARADGARDAVLDGLDPQPGERALDLYSGVGLFAAALGAPGRADRRGDGRGGRRAAPRRRRGATLPTCRRVRDRAPPRSTRAAAARLRLGRRPRRARPAARRRRPGGRRRARRAAAARDRLRRLRPRRRSPATSGCFCDAAGRWSTCCAPSTCSR